MEINSEQYEAKFEAVAAGFVCDELPPQLIQIFLDSLGISSTIKQEQPIDTGMQGTGQNTSQNINKKRSGPDAPMTEAATKQSLPTQTQNNYKKSSGVKKGQMTLKFAHAN